MGVKHFSELDAWKLSVELKRGAYKLLQAGPVARDTAYCGQVVRAAASAPANIAEGFARFQHADFVRFLRIALGSLEELENHLLDGVDRGHFGPAAIEPLLVLKRRSAASVAGLIRYLRASKAGR